VRSFTDVLWSNCETIARRALFGIGMIFAWSARDSDGRDDADAVALKQVCPGDSLLYPTVLEEVQSAGGPTIMDKVTPAEWMIGRVLSVSWPVCDAKRRELGYPQVVEIQPGEFDWGQPCAPCMARERLLKEQEQAAAEEDKAFWEIEKKRWKIVPPAQAELRAKLTSSGGLYQVSGSIKNKSVVELSGIKLNVTAYDCATDATPLTRCDVIGHRDVTTYVDVPPGQIRTFYQVLDFTDLAASHGVLASKVETDSVRAPLDASDKVPDLLEMAVHSHWR
jgi:hypothetical protein